jgi:hypothetical protein
MDNKDHFNQYGLEMAIYDWKFVPDIMTCAEKNVCIGRQPTYRDLFGCAMRARRCSWTNSSAAKTPPAPQLFVTSCHHLLLPPRESVKGTD